MNTLRFHRGRLVNRRSISPSPLRGEGTGEGDGLIVMGGGPLTQTLRASSSVALSLKGRGLRSSRGFTLIEALVSTALIVVLFIAVGQAFSIASQANGRIVAHAELIETAAAFESAVRDKLSMLRPGLLIIMSPDPLGSGGAYLGLRQDTPIGPAAVPLRHDRLVFIAQSEGPAFESVTDVNNPSATNVNNDLASTNGVAGYETDTGRRFTSSQALIYFGPSFPDGRKLAPSTVGGFPSAGLDGSLTGRDWILSQRVLLLGVPGVASLATPSFAPYSAFLPSPLTPPYFGIYPLSGFNAGSPGTIYRGESDAVTETAEQLMERIEFQLGPFGGGAIGGLTDCNFAPTEVTMDLTQDSFPSGPFYTGRNAFGFLPRVADLRIEWTDGSAVLPTNVYTGAGAPLGAYQAQLPLTQWYGQPRDTGGGSPNWKPPGIPPPPPEGDVCPKQLWLSMFDGAQTRPESSNAAFGIISNAGQIEFQGPPAVPVNQGGPLAYAAIWKNSTWQFRPKALRFTFRVYDSQDRTSSEEIVNTTPWFDPATLTPDPVRRWGQEFSFVVPVP